MTVKQLTRQLMDYSLDKDFRWDFRLSTQDYQDGMIPLQDSSVGEILTVIEDRLRLPFKGGALRLPLGEG